MSSHTVLLTETDWRFGDAVLWPPNGEKLTVWWRRTLSSSPWQVDGLMTSHAVLLTETEWRFGYATHSPPHGTTLTVWWRRTLSSSQWQNDGFVTPHAVHLTLREWRFFWRLTLSSPQWQICITAVYIHVNSKSHLSSSSAGCIPGPKFSVKD